MGSPKRFHVLLFLSLLLLAVASTFTAVSTPATAAESDGWVEQNSGTEEDLFSVSAVDAYTAWAVGAAGTVLRTTDGGQTWEALDAGVTSQLKAVAAVSGEEAWIGGEGGILLHTEDGGQSWEAELLPEDSTVYDIAALDDKTCWVVGATGWVSGGFIMKTEDDGETWEHQVSGHAYALYSISAVDEDIAWAAGGDSTYGGSGGVILRTTNGGDTWASVGPTDRSWFNIAACDGMNAIAWGTYNYGNFFPPIVFPECKKTADGGGNWATPFFNILAYLFHPAGSRMFDAEDIWVAGGSFNVNIAIARSANGGVSWSHQVPAGTYFLHDISTVGLNIAWAVGAGGLIMFTEDGGYTGPAPVMTSLEPDQGTGEEDVIIHGSGFGTVGGTVNFGPISASITSWSDTEIVCKPYPGTPGTQVPVFVTTPGGTSNSLPFTYKGTVNVESVYPTRGYQFNPAHNVTITGSGFQPGAKVMLAKGSTVINAANVNVVAPDRIYCTLNLMGAAPGVYDVVVVNPDGGWGRLSGAFTVVSPCGQGSGTALLMLGASLGLLSLAGSRRLRRLRKAQRRK